MNVYASGWYETSGSRNFDHNHGDCHAGRKKNRDGDHYAIRKHKGSRRRKRYHCVNLKMGSNGQQWKGGPSTYHPTSTDAIRWGSSNQGHHPCKHLGSSYTYLRNSTFPGAHFGFKCSVPANKIPILLNVNSTHINAAGATDSGNNRRNIKHQLLFGSTMKGGQQTGTGYCMKKENLAKKIGNQTCYQLIENTINKAKAEQTARAYCETSRGRTDEKCKCINVAGSGFLNRCRANPNWAGCKEIIPGVKQLEKLLAKSNIPERSFGNADCIVPDICSGNVYKPMSNTPACQIQMAVCNQVMNQKDVKAYGDLKTVQSCNINFSSEQAK